MTRWLPGFALVSLALGLAATVSAQEPSPKGGADEDRARMEAWQKASTPGEAHKRLEAIVGTFDAKVRSRLDPSHPPEDSVATSVNSWVLGGRFVEQQFDGTMMGEPFSGIGYAGYDNIQKKFVSVWMNTAGTGIMCLTGTADARGKTITGRSTMWDPEHEKPFPVESKLVIIDNDHHTFELVGKAPNGRLTKLIEIQYTRKKS